MLEDLSEMYNFVETRWFFSSRKGGFGLGFVWFLLVVR